MAVNRRRVPTRRRQIATRRRQMPTRRTTASLKRRRPGAKRQLSARQIQALRLLARRNAARRGGGSKEKVHGKPSARGYRNLKETARTKRNNTNSKTLKRRVLKGQGNATGRRRKSPKSSRK